MLERGVFICLFLRPSPRENYINVSWNRNWKRSEWCDIRLTDKGTGIGSDWEFTKSSYLT